MAKINFANFLSFIQRRDRFYIPLNVAQFFVISIFCLSIYIQEGTSMIRDDRSWRTFPSVEVFCHIFHNILTTIMIERFKVLISPQNDSAGKSVWRFNQMPGHSKKKRSTRKESASKSIDMSKVASEL